MYLNIKDFSNVLVETSARFVTFGYLSLQLEEIMQIRRIMAELDIICFEIFTMEFVRPNLWYRLNRALAQLMIRWEPEGQHPMYVPA